MAHPAGEAESDVLRLDFDRRLMLQFRGSVVTSDAGLLAACRSAHRRASRPPSRSTQVKNGRHALVGLLRQSVQMGRFETQWLAAPENFSALADLSGQWIELVHGRRPPKGIVLDMDSSVSPTHGEQEMSVWNGHYACTCYHPLFVFNQFGDLERCALRPGNVHSADGWDHVLKPVVARYQGNVSRIYFRADAGFASPEVYEFLEGERIKYAIRLPANRVLQDRIGYLLRRPVGRPPNDVRRFHANFTYQAGSWTKPRRVIAKVEWHPGELYPRVGFIVTNLSRLAERVVAFYNKRGTCEQWIKEGKGEIKWTRLSCRTFAANAVRLQLHALAYNLGNFLRTLATPEPIKDWSLTSLKEKLIKIGAKVVSHRRYVAFQMAEVAIPWQMFQEILRLIAELRPQQPPAPA
jgi:Transposase DDE domain group 1